MILVLIGVVVVSAVYWLLSPATPIVHRRLSVARFATLVDVLYRRGFDGGELRVRVADSDEPILRLVKSIVVDDDVRLGLELAQLDDLSSDERINLDRALGWFGLPVPGLRQSLDLGGDSKRAAAIARAILEEGFRLNLHRDCAVTLHDVSERNIRIGWTR
ncbi:MAG TPA: hypothetical protein VFU02_15065 [Polyangiaceae bacterium]|nr:hypothetical protein [Polyangiaceae bacterium]